MKINRKTLLAAACSLIVILSAGCAALSTLTTKQETLEERVKNYMQARIDGKWDHAYTFIDSASRERIPREQYRPGKIAYKGFTIEEITVLPSGDQATVKLRIDISFKGYDFKRASQTQNWVKEKGGWFIKPPPQSRKNPFSLQEKQE